LSTEAPFVDLLAPHCRGEALDRVARYAELLERWSRRHNLVRYSSRRELVGRHLVDSLAAAPFLGGSGRLLDVGSGAGLPGVPLLAACPGWSGVLLEPRQKRWAFLRLVVRELGLSAEVDRARYQDFVGDATWDAITARAVGDFEGVLDWARPRVSVGGQVVVWTTDDTEADLRETRGWRVLSSSLPGLDRGRLVRFKPCFT
jgi:16S rRNA (guanine527-N7)-methyltransferase